MPINSTTEQQETLFNSKQFQHVYPVSKTLKFRLKPIPQTIRYIEQQKMLTKDENLSASFKQAKKILDNEYQGLVGQILSAIDTDTFTRLVEAYQLAVNSSDSDRTSKLKNIAHQKVNLEKFITKNSQKYSDFDSYFKKDIFEIIYSNLTVEDKKLIDEFEGFSSYFTQYFALRKDMFKKSKHGTIAKRIIDNLDRYINNIKIYNEKIKPTVTDIGLIDKELYSGRTSIDEFFLLKDYHSFITQDGINEYNLLLGGQTLENKKLQGLNEVINEYNQKHSQKLPLIKQLNKQILMEQQSLSFIFDTFNSDEDVENGLSIYYENINSNKHKYVSLFEDLSNYQVENIYISPRSYSQLSCIFEAQNWSLIREALGLLYDKTPNLKINKKYYEKREAYQKSTHSVKEIQDALSVYFESRGDTVYNNLVLPRLGEVMIKKLHELFSNKPNLTVDAKDEVKNLLDGMKELHHLFKVFDSSIDLQIDEVFYSKLDLINQDFSALNALYNKVRNYITTKDKTNQRFKVNLNCSTLLSGWSKSKESSYLGILLIKDDKYYLGVMNTDIKGANQSFSDITANCNDSNYHYKMDYYQVGGANKQLPKIFLSDKGQKEYQPSDEIKMIYKTGTFKKDSSTKDVDNFNLSDCHKFIDYYKECIFKRNEYKVFNFKFSPTSSYHNINDFYIEVDQQGYKINKIKIADSYINQLVESNKLFLFELYNKDFSVHSKGTPNLFTLYWHAVFSDDNLKHGVYKLNGEAEIFYRKKRRELSVNEATKWHHYNELKDKFNYPIIKDKRFFEDQFFLHVPITANYKAPDKININQRVNQYVKANFKHMNIIGIDRGERNLLYIVIINSQGKIIYQQSLNKIKNTNNNSNIDYLSKLNDKQSNRDAQRKSWGEIENIKELKDGYLSICINQILKLAREHNAVIVLEDLSSGFKNSRLKIDKSVYQKFEEKLINKLNYCIFKDTGHDQSNSNLYNAYQLADKFVSFEKLGKQSGILYYIPAWHTSKVDPTTGFIDVIKPKYTNKDESIKLIKKLDISYNHTDKAFDISFNMNDFADPEKVPNKRWTITTMEGDGGDSRYYYDNKKKQDKNSLGTEVNEQLISLDPITKVNVNERVIQLFKRYDINYEQHDLTSIILSKDLDSQFFKEFVWLLGILLRLRYIDNSNKDYILSPVKHNGKLFNSLLYTGHELPRDPDANGAYHIALKGLYTIQKQILHAKPNDKGMYNIKPMTNLQWLNYLYEIHSTK